ncbi:hypothetical protein DACRYDRAFT_105229 [Dacryopinax primogenitus]|uniref:Uncharacterized protein n=1 Tax=Dacryopinax primogenitus (strain DJM 731) TaxID=1858805 RepID=M5G7M3_DACPD|nr:uncharacterized protein DACRYDRAFT_105229 [Dacryopinax primogenitus]EJU04160.1 hypothetical protein DACRYDRAFT_105229 [Dacryopinax primogenitus]
MAGSQRASTISDDPLIHTLEYTVVGASSHANPYRPERILEDNPNDPASRWSAEVKSPGKTWIVLKLKFPSLLASITFRKYYKPHPCNLNEFEVWTGSSQDRFQIQLRDKLKDNDEAEIFFLHNEEGSHSLPSVPCQFVKIVPLSSHAPKFNASIWNVVLRGIDDAGRIQELNTALQETKERESMRIVMKFLRQRGLEDATSRIQKATRVPLEDPVMSRLYSTVVNDMDYEAAELVVEDIAAKGGFSSCLRSSNPRALWRKLDPASKTGTSSIPCPRRGHAIVLGPNQHIYLLGGCNGTTELSDFWRFDIVTQQWHLISADTHKESGPGARAGHTMNFDPRTGSIFVFGRHVDVNRCSEMKKDAEQASDVSVPPDFFRYTHCRYKKATWERLSMDTLADGGPGLLSGHRTVIDSDSQMLYVFGGKISAKQRAPIYSGLYRYDIAARTWKMIFDDKIRGGPLLSRTDHGLVFDSSVRTLCTFGGTRDGAQLADIWTIRLSSGEASPAIESMSKLPMAPGVCQASILHGDIGEIRVFVPPRSASRVPSVWSLGDSWETWRVLETEVEDATLLSTRPTDSSQSACKGIQQGTFDVVYDGESNRHYLFGNDGLWSMNLRSPSSDEAIRKCRFILRKQRQAVSDVPHTNAKSDFA